MIDLPAMTHSENMPPAVSVVIPVHNAEEFLEETLLSVLSSVYPNMEIIIVDDGSTDGSPAVAARYAGQYAHIRFLQQPNAGAAAARNRAVAEARGEYILPVDADDRISPQYISLAVEAISGRPDVKVVYPEAEFFGERSGKWRLPPFSIRLLARKNMIPVSGLYRREDWVRAGGYRTDTGREDWVFWIAILKDGGKVVRLNHTGLYYRVRSGSKRKKDRKLLTHTIDILNGLYPDFFLRELKGPLRYRRTWSRLINTCCGWIHARKTVVHPSFKSLEPFMLRLPYIFREQGETMCRGRNTLKLFRRDGYELVVKSYRHPHLLNAVIYGFLRASKAGRAYRYALRLLAAGVGTPAPVGFVTCRRYFLFADSYSVTLRSSCPYTYRDLATRTFFRRDEILEAIARTTARMHENGILHKDYSAGNILFDDRPRVIPVEIVDLNRMSFGKTGLEKGCRNFKRLPATDEMIAVIATCYAKERGGDPERCMAWMK
ncbi:MAG: glycosyltransferase [Tannerella sp.]|jgi:glycosyltransferase involved in cell wall biosynthesis|nr:glycosyltransferase [Tannerella sp.]